MKKIKIAALLCAVAIAVMSFSGCTLSISSSKNENEQIVWDFLIEKIGNPYGAAGLMANLQAESNLKPTNLQNSYEKKLGMSDAEYTEAVDNGTYENFVYDAAGYGIAQWTFWSRKQGLLNYAKEKGTSIGNLEMQLEYLWKELQGYKSLMETLKTATDVQTASDKVLTDFERPANMEAMKEKRASIATTYLERYGEDYI